MNTKKVLLQGKHIYKSYKQGTKSNQVLNDVNVEIYEGDFTVIMGSSGAGKSTLLYCLSGMDSVSDGEVIYQGQEISRYREKQMADLRTKEFGFVFQQTHLVSNLTLFENVAVAGYACRERKAKEVQEKAVELLSRMCVEDARTRFPSQVSGGEAQRAAIARAVINHPGLVFADEPTGALNKSNSEEVLGLLTDLHQEGQGIVMVTHDVRAALHGTRILYMEDGRILDELLMGEYEEEDGESMIDNRAMSYHRATPYNKATPYNRAREKKIMDWLSSLHW